MGSFAKLSGALAATVLLTTGAQAGIITTEFDTSDGFVTGDTGDVTLTDGAGFEVTFSGGQQQQMFDGPSYNNGPAADLFINDGPGDAGFDGANPNTGPATGDGINDDIGNILFNVGASSVSFFAANRANGASSTVNVFGLDGALLTSAPIPNGAAGDNLFTFTADDLGAGIGRIEFDLAGPAANPPYVVAVDSFTVQAPEPGMLSLFGAFALVGLVARRRRVSQAA